MNSSHLLQIQETSKSCHFTTTHNQDCNLLTATKIKHFLYSMNYNKFIKLSTRDFLHYSTIEAQSHNRCCVYEPLAAFIPRLLAFFLPKFILPTCYHNFLIFDLLLFIYYCIRVLQSGLPSITHYEGRRQLKGTFPHVRQLPTMLILSLLLQP